MIEPRLPAVWRRVLLVLLLQLLQGVCGLSSESSSLTEPPTQAPTSSSSRADQQASPSTHRRPRSSVRERIGSRALGRALQSSGKGGGKGGGQKGVGAVEALRAFRDAQPPSVSAPGGCLHSWTTGDPSDGSWRGVSRKPNTRPMHHQWSLLMDSFV